MEEKEIRDAVQRQVKTPTGQRKAAATDFIARRNTAGKWEVEFSYLGADKRQLGLKRGGVREFSTLDTVCTCLANLGVYEFKVAA